MDDSVFEYKLEIFIVHRSKFVDLCNVFIKCVKLNTIIQIEETTKYTFPLKYHLAKSKTWIRCVSYCVSYVFLCVLIRYVQKYTTNKNDENIQYREQNESNFDFERQLTTDVIINWCNLQYQKISKHGSSHCSIRTQSVRIFYLLLIK